jgi:hypothetical protein
MSCLPNNILCKTNIQVKIIYKKVEWTHPILRNTIFPPVFFTQESAAEFITIILDEERRCTSNNISIESRRTAMERLTEICEGNHRISAEKIFRRQSSVEVNDCRHQFSKRMEIIRTTQMKNFSQVYVYADHFIPDNFPFGWIPVINSTWPEGEFMFYWYEAKTL